MRRLMLPLTLLLGACAELPPTSTRVLCFHGQGEVTADRVVDGAIDGNLTILRIDNPGQLPAVGVIHVEEAGCRFERGEAVEPAHLFGGP